MTGVKIKNKAVTASKINTSGLTVPNATHATSADSATSATNATNATTAANATDLGGVAASGYVKNSGTIYIPTGHANWQQFNSTDNDKVSRFTDTQAFTATATGGESLRFDPITPSSLYGQKLAFSGVRMCYQASAAASITHVFLEINTEATSSPERSSSSTRTTPPVRMPHVGCIRPRLRSRCHPTIRSRSFSTLASRIRPRGWTWGRSRQSCSRLRPSQR